MAKTKKRSGTHKPKVADGQPVITEMDLGYIHPSLSFDVTIVPATVDVFVWCWGGLNSQTPRLLGKIAYAPGDDFGSIVANVGGDASSTGQAWTEIRSTTGELINRSPTDPFSE